MAAIRSLTERGIVLTDGQVSFVGAAESAIQAYIATTVEPKENVRATFQGRGAHTKILIVQLLDAAGSPTAYYTPGEGFNIGMELETDGTRGLSLELFLRDESYSPVGLASTYLFHGQMLPTKPGRYTCRVQLEPLRLASGPYYVEVRTSQANVCWDHCVENACRFEVPFSSPTGRECDFRQSSGFGPLAWLLTSGAVSFLPLTG
jgi:lipopolysaccharide transport system ATP-binding protein